MSNSGYKRREDKKKKKTWWRNFYLNFSLAAADGIEQKRRGTDPWYSKRRAQGSSQTRLPSRYLLMHPFYILSHLQHLSVKREAGANTGFSLGGGAQKSICPHAHYERGTELTFGRGPGARLWALEARVVLMLSRVIWALFWSILIQNWI